MDSRALAPGKEEYLDSEKYEIRHWNLDDPDSLAPFIARLNAARRDNPALQRNEGLHFLDIDNEMLIAYGRTCDAERNAVLVVVNLDPHNPQSGWVMLDPAIFGVDRERAFQVHDLLTGARFLWSGPRNYVTLDPARSPAHVFVVRRRVRSEHDFDYFQ
jgi:starch synthase (maltosyl-transferring)